MRSKIPVKSKTSSLCLQYIVRRVINQVFKGNVYLIILTCNSKASSNDDVRVKCLVHICRVLFFEVHCV